MSLSVLQLAPNGHHILYDSDQEKAILMGTQEEMFDWKNLMETIDQNISNRLYFDQLREERMALLVNAGHTQQSAENFLKKQMPYLYNEGA
jgi:hypothetical protein